MGMMVYVPALQGGGSSSSGISFVDGWIVTNDPDMPPFKVTKELTPGGETRYWFIINDNGEKKAWNADF